MKQAKKRKNKTLALGITLGLLCANTVVAAENGQKGSTIAQHVTSGQNSSAVGFEIALGAEFMEGHTTYSIGYPITAVGGGTTEGYFPFSELEWPLDMWFARIDGSINIGSSWRINGTLKKNISDPSEKMIDKDWLTPANPGQLDVYSESNISDQEAMILDADLEWTFLQRQSVNFYSGLGYQYQDFRHEGALIQQFSPSGLPGYDYTGDGSVAITYEMTYKMLYLLIGGDLKINPDFIISGRFAYSPWVNADDEDNHVLRNKINYGDMGGEAYMVDLSGTYYFVPSWFMEVGFHYTKIEVDGDQNQLFFGVPTFIVHAESESTQTSGYLTIGYRF